MLLSKERISYIAALEIDGSEENDKAISTLPNLNQLLSERKGGKLW